MNNSKSQKFDWYTKILFLTANLVTKCIFLLKSNISLRLNTYQPRYQDSLTSNKDNCVAY